MALSKKQKCPDNTGRSLSDMIVGAIISKVAEVIIVKAAEIAMDALAKRRRRSKYTASDSPRAVIIVDSTLTYEEE